MIEHFRQILTGQFEAALCMLHGSVTLATAEQWEVPIASLSLRQVAYHTLFFTDYYLSPSENDFALREFHHRGGDERQPAVCVGLPQDETLAYVDYAAPNPRLPSRRKRRSRSKDRPASVARRSAGANCTCTTCGTFSITQAN